MAMQPSDTPQRPTSFSQRMRTSAVNFRSKKRVRSVSRAMSAAITKPR